MATGDSQNKKNGRSKTVVPVTPVPPTNGTVQTLTAADPDLYKSGSVPQYSNGGTTPTPTVTPPTTVNPSNVGGVQVTPGKAKSTDQINVADLSGQLATDPNLLISKNQGTSLTATTPLINGQQITAGQQSTDPSKGNPNQYDQTAVQGKTAQGTLPSTAAKDKTAEGYNVTGTQANVAQNAQATGQNGTINQNDLVDPSKIQIDTNAVANGQTATGQALNQYASLDLNNIDPRATEKGQLDALQADFTDPVTGQPRIPAWASGAATQVSRIASFTGMTGTAATAAMANAIMQASLPIAKDDSQFYQTVTMQNLNNKQQSTINKANILANMDLANLDARTKAAVTNSQAFMQMDMANLNNDQQAEVLNTQERFQSILTDANAKNVEANFDATNQNQKDEFYDQLGTQMSEFNTTQANTMSQFNAGQTNNMEQFNSSMDNNRDQFYKTMAFNIDANNAKWRQTVTLQNNSEQFQAAATDVKDRLGVSQEALNQLWDRADAMLDYSWKAGQNDADRKNQLALVALKGELDNKAADAKGTGDIIGTIVGAIAGWLF